MSKWVAVKSRSLFLLFIIAVLLLVSACSGNTDQKEANDKPQNGQSAQTEGTGGTEEGNAEQLDPLGRFDPPIELTVGRVTNPEFKFGEGESIDKNVWTELYESRLGIKVSNEFVVDSSQSAAKINVAIAAGEIPDLITVNNSQLQQLAEAGLLADMTEVLGKYGSEKTKEILNADGGHMLKSATIDGKLMAIPHSGAAIDGTLMVWIRKDWLDNLNLPEPKTVDDILNISKAFATQDPDKNGKNDTFGFELRRDLFNDFAALDGFLNMYNAYQSIWLKGADGKLVYSSIQPEMRAALQKLQEMFKAGEIDKEFAVKDMGRAAESIASGKTGMFFGTMASAIYPLQDAHMKDKNALWQPYLLPSVGGGQAKVQIPAYFNLYYAVSSKVKHPEAAIKMLNILHEKKYVEEDQEYFLHNGLPRYWYPIVRGDGAKDNLEQHIAIVEAMKNKDTSKLTKGQLNTYNQVQSYFNGDENYWKMERIFGENGAFSIVNQYTNDMYVRDAFVGAPTETLIEKGATLSTMIAQVFTKIIMGAPIEEFDKLVADWNKLGGEKLTEEVNAWYASEVK
ncbi:extracellular solute-binding protein [Paenibacillus sp. GCM10027626]|uniref:extracellular solute-binding protein n=1 Tax=Paenibacillus sp. GCM10027626 TaxID=3273411 RepID=UPI00363BAB40